MLGYDMWIYKVYMLGTVTVINELLIELPNELVKNVVKCLSVASLQTMIKFKLDFNTKCSSFTLL